MPGEKDLHKLLETIEPKLQPGDYVFCTVEDLNTAPLAESILIFRENEGITVILRKEMADKLGLHYSFVAAWITLTVHSSLEAVGLTAAFSKALAENGVSCNVVAAFYHDHLFVRQQDTAKAMEILNGLSAMINFDAILPKPGPGPAE
jgi:hypothetical protein